MDNIQNIEKTLQGIAKISGMNEFFIQDTETTGLDKNDSIYELAGYHYKNGKAIKVHYYLEKPKNSKSYDDLKNMKLEDGKSSPWKNIISDKEYEELASGKIKSLHGAKFLNKEKAVEKIKELSSIPNITYNALFDIEKETDFVRKNLKDNAFQFRDIYDAATMVQDIFPEILSLKDGEYKGMGSWKLEKIHAYLKIQANRKKLGITKKYPEDYGGRTINKQRHTAISDVEDMLIPVLGVISDLFEKNKDWKFQNFRNIQRTYIPKTKNGKFKTKVELESDKTNERKRGATNNINVFFADNADFNIKTRGKIASRNKNSIKSHLREIAAGFAIKRKGAKNAEELKLLEYQEELETLSDALNVITQLEKMNVGEEVSISSYNGGVVNKYVQAYLYGKLDKATILKYLNTDGKDDNARKAIDKSVSNLEAARNEAMKSGVVKRASQNPLKKKNKFVDTGKKDPNAVNQANTGTAFHMIREKNLSKEDVEKIPFIGDKTWSEFISDPKNAKYKNLDEDMVMAFQPIASQKDRVMKRLYIDRLFASNASFENALKSDISGTSRKRVAAEQSLATVRKGKDGKIYLTTGSVDLVTGSDVKGQSSISDYKTTSKDDEYVLGKPEYIMQQITYRHMENVHGNNVLDLFLYIIPSGENAGDITKKYKIAYTYYKGLENKQEVSGIFKKYKGRINNWESGADLQSLLSEKDYIDFVNKMDKSIMNIYNDYRESESKNDKAGMDRAQRTLENLLGSSKNKMGWLGIRFVEVTSSIQEKSFKISEDFNGYSNNDAREYERAFFETYGYIIKEMIRLSKDGSPESRKRFAELFNAMRDPMHNFRLHAWKKVGNNIVVFSSNFWGSSSNLSNIFNFFEQRDVNKAFNAFSKLKKDTYSIKDVQAITFRGMTVSRLVKKYASNPKKLVEDLQSDLKENKINESGMQRVVNSFFSMTNYEEIDKRTGLPTISGEFQPHGNARAADAIRKAMIDAGLYAPMGRGAYGAVVDYKESLDIDRMQLLNPNNYEEYTDVDGKIKYKFKDGIYGLSINGHWISEYLHVWTNAYNKIKELEGPGGKNAKKNQQKIEELKREQEKILTFLFSVADIYLTDNSMQQQQKGKKIIDSIRKYIADEYQKKEANETEEQFKKRLENRNKIFGFSELEKQINDLLGAYSPGKSFIDMNKEESRKRKSKIHIGNASDYNLSLGVVINHLINLGYKQEDLRDMNGDDLRGLVIKEILSKKEDGFDDNIKEEELNTEYGSRKIIYQYAKGLVSFIKSNRKGKSKINADLTKYGGRMRILSGTAQAYWSNPFFEQDKEIYYKMRDEVEKIVSQMTLAEYVEYIEQADPNASSEMGSDSKRYGDLASLIRKRFDESMRYIGLFVSFRLAAEIIQKELDKSGVGYKGLNEDSMFDFLVKKYGKATSLGEETVKYFERIKKINSQLFAYDSSGKISVYNEDSEAMLNIINSVLGETDLDTILKYIQNDLGLKNISYDISKAGSFIDSVFGKQIKNTFDSLDKMKLVKNFKSFLKETDGGEHEAFKSGVVTELLSDLAKKEDLNNDIFEENFFGSLSESGLSVIEKTQDLQDIIGYFKRMQSKEDYLSMYVEGNKNITDTEMKYINAIRKMIGWSEDKIEKFNNSNTKEAIDKLTQNLKVLFRKVSKKVVTDRIEQRKAISEKIKDIFENDDLFSFVENEDEPKGISREDIKDKIRKLAYSYENEEDEDSKHNKYFQLLETLISFNIPRKYADLNNKGKLIYYKELVNGDFFSYQITDVIDTSSQELPLIPVVSSNINKGKDDVTLVSEEKSYKEFEFQYNYGGNYSNILKADLIQIKTNGGWVEIKMDNNGTLTTVGTNNTLAQSSNVVSKVNIVGNQEYKAGGSPVTYIVDDNGKIIATVYKEKNVKGKFDWGEGGLYGFMDSLKGMGKGEIEKAVMDKFNGPDKRYLNQDGIRNKRGDDILNFILGRVLGTGSGSSSGGAGLINSNGEISIGQGTINIQSPEVNIKIQNAEAVYGSGVGSSVGGDVSVPADIAEEIGASNKGDVFSIEKKLKEYENLLAEQNKIEKESAFVRNNGGGLIGSSLSGTALNLSELYGEKKIDIRKRIAAFNEEMSESFMQSSNKEAEKEFNDRKAKLDETYERELNIQEDTLKAKEEEKEYAKQRAEYERDINEVIKAEANIYKNEEKKKLSNSGVFRNAKEIAALDAMIEQDRARAAAARARMAEKESGNFGFMFNGDDSQRRIESGLNYKKAQIDVSNKGATSIYDQMANQINRRVQAVIDYGAAAKIINTIPRTIQKITQITKQLDAALTNIRIVTGYTREETQALITGYADLAQQLGMTTQQVTTSANEWLRQGYSVAEVNNLITATAQLASLGQIDMGQSVQYLTSLMKGFKLEVSQASDAVSVLTKLDQEYAVSAGGIAEALAQTASSARLAGISLEEVASYVTIIGETTQQSMSSVGQAMKTIIARYGNVKAGNFASLVGDSEDTENLNDIEKVLGALGIQIRSTTMEFRPLSDVLDEVAAKWQSLTSVEQSAVSTAFGGTRQREQFLVLMNNWDEVKKAEESAMNSAGTAAEKYEAVLDSLQASVNRLTATWEKFTSTLSKSRFLKILTDAASGLVSSISTIAPILLGTFAARRGGDLLSGAWSSTLSLLGIKQKDKKLDPQVSAIEDLKDVVKKGFENTNALQRGEEVEETLNNNETTTSIGWRDKHPKLAKGFGFVDAEGNKVSTGKLVGKGALGGAVSGLTRALSLDWQSGDSEQNSRNALQTGISTFGGIASAFGPWGMAIGAVANIVSTFIPKMWKLDSEERKERVETAQKQLTAIQQIEEKMDTVGEISSKAVEDRTSEDYKQLREAFSDAQRMIAEGIIPSDLADKLNKYNIEDFTGETKEAIGALTEYETALKTAEATAAEAAQEEQRYNLERKIANAQDIDERKYYIQQLTALNKEIDDKMLEVAYVSSGLKYMSSSNISGASLQGVINRLARELSDKGVKVYGSGGEMLTTQKNNITSYLRSTGKFNNLFTGGNITYGRANSAYAQKRRQDILNASGYDNFQDLIAAFGNKESYDKLKESYDKLDEDLQKIEDEIYNLDDSNIIRIAHAFGLTVEEANKLSGALEGLTSADAVLGIDKVIERYKTFGEVLSDIADNSGLSSENLSKIYTTYGYLTVGKGSAQENIISNMASIFGGKNSEIPLVAATSTKRSLQTNTDFWNAIMYQAEKEGIELPKGVVGKTTWSEAIPYLEEASDLQKLINERTEEYVELEIKEIKEVAQSKLVEYREKMIDNEVSGLESIKNILGSINEERKKELELIKAKEALENARNEKVGVYRAGVGFTYETDANKVREAQENLEKLEQQKYQDDLEYQMNQLKNEKDILTAIQEAPKWENLKDFYEKTFENGGTLPEFMSGEAMSEMVRKAINGTTVNAKAEEEREKLDNLTEFLSGDNSLSALEENIESANTVSERGKEIDAYNESLAAYQEVLKSIDSTTWSMFDEYKGNKTKENWLNAAGYLDDKGELTDAGKAITTILSGENYKKYNAATVGKSKDNIIVGTNIGFGDKISGNVTNADLGFGHADANDVFTANGNSNLSVDLSHDVTSTALSQLYHDQNSGDFAGYDDHVIALLNEGGKYVPYNLDYYLKGHGTINRQNFYKDPSFEDAIIFNPDYDDYAFYISDGKFYSGSIESDGRIFSFDASGTQWDDSKWREYMVNQMAQQLPVKKSMYNATRTHNANGAYDFVGGGSLINEFGSEAIVTPSGTITSLPTHTGIVPADLTKNLFNLGAVAPNLVRELNTNKLEKGNSSLSEDNSTNINTLNATFKVDQTFDFEQFIRDAKQVASNNRYSY